MFTKIHIVTYLRHAKDGVFHERSISLTRVPVIDVAWEGLHASTSMAVSWIRKLQPRRKFFLFDFQHLEKEVEDAPLSERGWVLQERLLSQVFHFGSGQMYFERGRGQSSKMYFF